MKKVLSVLLVLGMLVSVGFATEKINFNKSDVGLLTKLDIPLNSQEANIIIKLVNLKLELLNAYADYGKNKTEKLELKIVKIMDEIDLLNSKYVKDDTKTDDWTDSWNKGYAAGDKQAKIDAMGEAFAIIKQQGYEAGVEHGKSIGYQKGYIAGASGQSRKNFFVNSNYNLFTELELNNKGLIQDAYNQGYATGHSNKKTYVKAYLKDPNIKQNAFNAGYKDGDNAGYNLVYQQGYEAGLAYYHSHH